MPSSSQPPRSRSDWLPLATVRAATVLAYAPIIDSLVRLGAQGSQALNAFLLVGAAAADAAYATLRRGAWRLAVQDHGLMLYSAACLMLVVGVFSGVWPLAVMALCLNLAALFSFCFGREGARVFYPALVGLGLVVLLLALVPQADHALRTVAARLSGWLLALAGFPVQVIGRAAPFGVAILVTGTRRVFDVASECNGIGIMTSTVALAAILGVRRGYRWFWIVPLTAAALAIGVAFNTLRIVAIAVASLETTVPYPWLHEGLGTLVYVVAIGVVFALARLPWLRRRAGAPAGASG
jgi:exosortase/archaeosortase family protein